MNSKKIGTFLMVMLVMSAVLILMATAKETPAGSPTESVQSTEPAEPAQSTADRVFPESEPSESALTTAPAQTESAPEQTRAAATLVERILEDNALDRTAVTRHVIEGTGQIDGVEGRADASAVHALAQIAGERQLNPVAAFWLMVSEGIYEKQEDGSGVLETAAFDAPDQAVKGYAYTDEGARQMLTDLLARSAEFRDETGLELAVLGADLHVESDQVFFSEEDGCRYAYFSCSSAYATHILCFYLRGDARGTWIEDVEFQLLSMRHADGDAAALEALDAGCDRQTASLVAAAELVLTGMTRADEGKISFRYQVAGSQASLERFHFTAEGERGTLTNYRLRAK